MTALPRLNRFFCLLSLFLKILKSNISLPNSLRLVRFHIGSTRNIFIFLILFSKLNFIEKCSKSHFCIKTAKNRDLLEFLSHDNRTYTSSYLHDNINKSVLDNMQCQKTSNSTPFSTTLQNSCFREIHKDIHKSQSSINHHIMPFICLSFRTGIGTSFMKHNNSIRRDLDNNQIQNLSDLQFYYNNLNMYYEYQLGHYQFYIIQLQIVQFQTVRYHNRFQRLKGQLQTVQFQTVRYHNRFQRLKGQLQTAQFQTVRYHNRFQRLKGQLQTVQFQTVRYNNRLQWLICHIQIVLYKNHHQWLTCQFQTVNNNQPERLIGQLQTVLHNNQILRPTCQSSAQRMLITATSFRHYTPTSPIYFSALKDYSYRPTTAAAKSSITPVSISCSTFLHSVRMLFSTPTYCSYGDSVNDRAVITRTFRLARSRVVNLEPTSPPSGSPTKEPTSPPTGPPTEVPTSPQTGTPTRQSKLRPQGIMNVRTALIMTLVATLILLITHRGRLRCTEQQQLSNMYWQNKGIITQYQVWLL